MSAAELHRLAALDNSALCAAMWSAHGLGVESHEGYVACAGTPPPLYPNLVTIDPDVDPQRQLGSIAERARRASGAFFVKDSYRALALDRLGFAPLFEAHWIHRAAGPAPRAMRLDWARVESRQDLAAWETAWGANANGPPLFPPAFLASPGMTMLAGRAGDAIAAGCIVSTTGAVAGLSNLFGDAFEAIGAAAKFARGRDLVGYESGDALAAACEAGFQTIGRLRVWRRP